MVPESAAMHPGSFAALELHVHWDSVFDVLAGIAQVKERAGRSAPAPGLAAGFSVILHVLSNRLTVS